MNEEYVAGFFDGEGSVGVGSWRFGKSYTLFCHIVNTDFRIINEIHNHFGGIIHVESDGIRNHRDKLVIRWNSIKCIEFLKKIYPYLIVKKEQVELAFKFPLNENRDKRTPEMIEKQKKIYLQIKYLKTINYEIPDKLKNSKQKKHIEMIRKKSLSKQLQIQGFSQSKIGEKLGVSQEMVSKYLNT